MDGQPTASAAEGRDDTSRRLTLLLESVTDYAILLLDPTGHVTSWNRGAARIKGYTAEEIIGRHFSAFYTDADRDRDHPAHELEIAAREGRYEEEGWRVRKDGTRFWANVLITALHDADGRLLGFGKVTRDLTARRLADEELRSSAVELRAANAELDQFRRLVASVRDYAIFMLDPGGHVASWNPGAEHIKGYAAEDIVGRHFSAFYTDADRDRDHPAHVLEIAARESRYEEEAWRVRKDGTRFWAGVLVTAVRDEQGVLVGFAKVTRDLTARREAEQGLRAAHAELRRSNEELDRFAMVAAHDLSEPLHTVAGFATLLARMPDLPEAAAAHVRHIATSADRMQRLIDSLLAYARAGGPARPASGVDVAGAVGAVVADLAAAIRSRGAEVATALDGAPTVLADAGDVEMVLRNLIGNAVKFGAPDAPRVEVRSRPAGEAAWRIEVDDDGAGVAAADRERIFAPFERAPRGEASAGTGLGLAICERVVRRAGGELGVEPRPGGGSRFWFTLPRAEPGATG